MQPNVVCVDPCRLLVYPTPLRALKPSGNAKPCVFRAERIAAREKERRNCRTGVDQSIVTDYLFTMLKQIAACEVADRPGRLEPRVLKRRRHGYPLMQKERAVLRAELRKQCT
jgi:hypothetical protein